MALALILLGAGLLLLGLRWRLAVGRLSYGDTSVIRLLVQSFSSRPEARGEREVLQIPCRSWLGTPPEGALDCISLPYSSW